MSSKRGQRGYLSYPPLAKRAKTTVGSRSNSAANGGTSANVVEVKMSTPPQNITIIGNAKTWGEIEAWLLSLGSTGHRARHIGIVQGDPGVGKTMGVHQLARKLRYVPIEIHCGDVGGERQFASELREATTRLSLLGKILVILDDVEGLDPDCVKVLCKISQHSEDSNPVVCTASAELPQSFKGLKGYVSSFALYPPKFDEIVRYGQQKWSHLPLAMLRKNATLCHGDVRQFTLLNVLPGLDNSTDPNVSKFTAARQLLYSSPGCSHAHEWMERHQPMLGMMLQENYLHAIQSGYLVEEEQVANHAERIAIADSTRAGNIHEMLGEAKCLWGAVAFGTGGKTRPSAWKVPPHLHFRPKQFPARDRHLTELERALNKSW